LIKIRHEFGAGLPTPKRPTEGSPVRMGLGPALSLYFIPDSS